MEPMVQGGIMEKVMVVLENHLKFISDDQEFSIHVELNDLVLDSMTAINILIDLEETFKVLFPDTLLIPKTFLTPKTLTNEVQSLVNQRGGESRK